MVVNRMVWYGLRNCCSRSYVRYSQGELGNLLPVRVRVAGPRLCVRHPGDSVRVAVQAQYRLETARLGGATCCAWRFLVACAFAQS